MEKTKRIEKKLKLIRKKGDLYDAISKKKNATPDTYERKLVKTYSLIFSRILYFYLVIIRRCKNSLTSVERIKEAQDEIRSYIGLPIDIYKPKDIGMKEKYKNLGIVYGNYNPYSKAGVRPSIENLEKELGVILDFCVTYNINDIYIDEFVLRRYLSKKFLDNLTHLYQSDMMRHEVIGAFSYLYLKVNLEELNDILIKLEENKYDNEYIYSFKDKIKDQVIKDAIETFEYDNDINALLLTVKRRLRMHINDEGVMKDRTYGKIYQNYEIGGPYLKMTVLDDDGVLISNNIISFYSYLELKDIASLEKRADIVTDTQEIDLISLLYLHLIGERQSEERDDKINNSLYDFIYNEYKEAGIRRRIPWINTRLQRLVAEFPQFAVSFYSVMLTIILYFLLKDVFPHVIPMNSSLLKKYNSFFEKIESVFDESLEFERNMINRLRQTIEKYLPKDMADEILNYSQKEMEYEDNTPKKVAEIEWFTDEEIPLYFASEYASNAHIYNGEFDFYIREPVVSYSNIVDCEPLFQIKTPISKSEFDTLDEENMFHIPLEAYPVGGDYALTRVIIKDEADETKYVIVDEDWVHKNLWDFTFEEKEILKSMEDPFIYYIYGMYENKFQISDMYISYSNENPQDIKSAILRGLNLDEDASNEEINAAITSKEYTEFPLYTPKDDIGELEYYERIASLDAIDIDLAGILTTMANEGYIYTVGYKNVQDIDTISTGEAYVWVMSLDGEVIDFAADFLDLNLKIQEESNEWNNLEEDNANSSVESDPDEPSEWSIENEDSKIKKVFDIIIKWAKEHHVSYILAAILAVMIINKIFGQKIRLRIKFNKAYKVLNEDNIADTYSELMKFIYGYKAVAIKRNQSEMVDLIYKEFYALDDKDIEELIAEIRASIKENKDAKSLKDMDRLLRVIPFIKEKRDELKDYKPRSLSLKH